MAQAQYDKFIELRKGGIDATTARKQAYGDTPAVNAAPVTQTTTPPQTIQGVGGQTFQVAPTNAQGLTIQPTVTPTPVAPSPTPSIAPEQTTPAPIAPTPTPVPAPASTQEVPKVTQKTEPINYNTSVGREQDIQKNISEITKGNPTLLKDRNAYNKAFGYDAADQGKKAILDASFQGGNVPMDQKSVTQALISGVSVPKQNTRAYNNAVVIADQYKRFNAMTPVQLLDNLKQGQIGTELDSLLSQNPNYVQAKAELAKAQKTASINRATAMAIGVISGKETPVVDDLKGIEAKYNPPLGANEQAYTNYVTNNPDVVSAGTQVKQLSNQISTLTTTYNDALKSIKAQYPDMPASALLTLMGSRTNETKTLLDSYINAKELAKGDFDLAMKMAEGHYTATAADIAQTNILKNKQAELQMTADFQKKQAEQALNDPATAISSVMDQFSKMGITSQQSLQTKIADAQKFIAQGGTLAGYIDKMRKDYMAKPEYKAYVEKTGGTDWQKLSDTTLFNPKTGETKAIGAGTTTPGTLPSSFTGDTASYIASKEGFRDKAYLDSAGIPTIGYGFTKVNGKPVKMGDTIDKATADAEFGKQIDAHSTWKTLIDPSTLSPSQQTALASFEYNLGPGIWNKSAMNIIDMVKSGNLSGAGVEMQKYINAGGKPVQGLINRRAEEAKLLMNSNTNSQTISPIAESWANNILGGKAKLSDLTGKENIALKNEVVKALDQKSGGKAGALENNTNEALDLINSLITHPGRTATTGVPSVFTNPFGFSLPASDSRDFKAEVDRLKALSFLNAIPQMKGMGALTEAEGAKLTASFSKLQELGLSDADYLKELNRVKSVLEKAKQTLGGNIEQTQSQQPQGNTNTGAGQTSPQVVSLEQEWLSRNK